MQEFRADAIYQELKKAEGILKNLREITGNEELNLGIGRLTQELKGIQLKVIEEVIKNVAGTYQPETSPGITENKTSILTEPKDITLAQAVVLIKKIEEKAFRMGIPVVIAVYNSAAHPVAVHSMEEAYIASFDIASNKAYTCAALKMSTSTLKTLSQPGGELYGIQHTNQGKIVIFGGGEPLFHNGRLIGSLGVSGGNEAQDTSLAAYGKNKLEEVLLWQ